MKTTTTLPVGRSLVLDRNLGLCLSLHPAPGSKLKLFPRIAAILAFLSWPVYATEVSLESAPPVVVKTLPEAGAADVDPGLTEIKVTYSKPMQDGSWSWSTWGEENFPETTGQPRYLSDGRTCVLPVKLQPGKFYATWLNSDNFTNFKDAGGRSAVPYLLTFTTASTTAKKLASFPTAEVLPGKLTFQGRYRHRSRGTDIETPSELWVKESQGGTLSVLARLPFRQSSDLASGDAGNRLTSYRSGSDPSGEKAGFQLNLELHDGLAKATRRGVRQDWDGKELKVPAGAWFDPNSRPDSYCAANILLRAFAVPEGETREFRVYDWDNSGEGLADYTIRIKHAGKEKVEVPAGTFDANHLVLTQVTSADTWFKKRAGHVTDFWVLDNHVIVRVLRHREPYEMVLLDFSVPEKLDPSSSARAVPAPPASRAGESAPAPASSEALGKQEAWLQLLNDDQRAVLAWTDRQFRSFFDARTFDGWSSEERATLESKLIDALNGPRSTEYYQAINSLAAMHSTKALPRLREIASERVDRNNRDRWMCIRALGILGDKESVPALIHLVYHGNVNTRWWAQISLVRITGKNFAKDWNAWGEWWNAQNGQPPYKPEIIRWWNGQAETDKLAGSLEEGDQKFFESLRGKSAATPVPAASTDVAARLRAATPAMEGIRDAWSTAVAAIQREDTASALASLRTLAPRIQEFRDTMKGTSLEAGTAEALETLKPLMAALEKGNPEAARTAMQPMLALGRQMEEQVKAVAEASPVPAPESVAGLANAVVLKRDDGAQKGVESIAGSGHAVQFQRSGETRYEARHVEAVQIFASRYGAPEPPAEDFHLCLLNEQHQVLADLKFPYSMIERGDPKWYTLRTPSIEVPEKFLVALNFNPHQTKGVYLAYSAITGAECHSLVGLPGDGFESWKPAEWMVRVSLTAVPTKAKGFQALADWKPPVVKDELANCRVASFGGDKSEGKQSYGGRGPAIRFKPAESLSGVRGNTPLKLKGVRLNASRYGAGYSPEEAQLHVIVRDASDATLAETDFAYAKFGYKAGWVDLVFDPPVAIQNPDKPLTIALDPAATQSKGIYFHYQKNPAASHSLAGSVASGFKELSDREWMVRACFE